MRTTYKLLLSHRKPTECFLLPNLDVQFCSFPSISYQLKFGPKSCTVLRFGICVFLVVASSAKFRVAQVPLPYHMKKMTKIDGKLKSFVFVIVDLLLTMYTDLPEKIKPEWAKCKNLPASMELRWEHQTIEWDLDDSNSSLHLLLSPLHFERLLFHFLLFFWCISRLPESWEIHHDFNTIN